MKKVFTINLIIFILFFSCGNREQVQVSEQENPPKAVTPTTPTPPPTLADISQLPPSARKPEDRISGDVSDLITFGSDNRDSASTTEASFTISGQVIPSATQLEVSLEGNSIASQNFSGTEAPHPFKVHLTKTSSEMKEGRNEYIFRVYKGDDYAERTFVLDVLPQSPPDLK